MKSRKLFSLMMLAALPVIAAGVLHAQTESQIAVTREDLQADRKAVVAANLPMTDSEAAAFWPIYRDYRMELSVVGDQLQKLITGYAKTYNEASMTDEQGLTLTKDYLKLRKSALDIRQKYVSKFNKVIPGRSVMRFYQIENKLDAAVELELAGSIPLTD